MISRRDFLKLIGIVPVVLKMPNLPSVVSPPSLPMANQSEWHLYSGTSIIEDVHIGMANAPWRPLSAEIGVPDLDIDNSL
jgi:hypothetical protein